MLGPLLTPIVLEDSLPSWPFGSKQPWWEGLETRGCGWAKPTTSKKRLVRHQFNSQQETLSNSHMNLDVYPHLVTLFKPWAPAESLIASLWDQEAEQPSCPTLETPNPQKCWGDKHALTWWVSGNTLAQQQAVPAGAGVRITMPGADAAHEHG